jgi:hypothetical protein
MMSAVTAAGYDRSGPATARRGRLWDRLPPIAWVVAYIALWGAVAFFPVPGNDLDEFFWPSARIAVAGQPLMVYQPAGQHSYPNANGPLALAPLTVAGVMVKALGWTHSMQLRRLVALSLFSLFILLMAREAVMAVERLRGRRLSGRARFFAYAAFAVAPPIWHSVAGYGHIEQPMELWLVLLAARWTAAERPLRGGAALGLAFLARSSATLLALPLLLAAGRQGIRRAAGVAIAGALVAGGGLLPFYLADRVDLAHSLFEFRPSLLVGSGSIWTFSRGTAWEQVAQHWDLAMVGALAVVINLWLATRSGGMVGGRIYAALALTAASFALLAKAVWPYYFLEVYIFGAVWALGRARASKAALISPLVVVSALGLFAEVGSTPNQSDSLVHLEAGAMFGLLSAAMLIALAMAGGGPSDELAGPPEPSSSGGF